MNCSKCKDEMDENDEITYEQIAKYAKVKPEPVCENCILCGFEQPTSH